MTDKGLLEFINTQTYIPQSFFDEGYKFWFVDNDIIRSPFPSDIQEKLKENSYQLFMEWAYELKPDEIKAQSEEELVEMFEMFLFNEGIKFVETEDEKISVCYPFMPRVGDKVDNEKGEQSEILERSVRESKEDNKKFLKVKLKSVADDKDWETEFELPA